MNEDFAVRGSGAGQTGSVSDGSRVSQSGSQVNDLPGAESVKKSHLARDLVKATLILGSALLILGGGAVVALGGLIATTAAVAATGTTLLVGGGIAIGVGCVIDLALNKGRMTRGVLCVIFALASGPGRGHHHHH